MIRFLIAESLSAGLSGKALQFVARERCNFACDAGNPETVAAIGRNGDLEKPVFDVRFQARAATLETPPRGRPWSAIRPAAPAHWNTRQIL